MTTARYPAITDDLLSAYIDNAITADERRLVDTAIADDPEIAWRLESLRSTVRLLRELPALALPRSFVLTPEQVGQTSAGSVATGAGAMTPATSPRRTQQQAKPVGFWKRMFTGWQEFWQPGSPALRNAMAASFAALLVLLMAPRFLSPDGQIAQVAQVGQVEQTAQTGVELQSSKQVLKAYAAAAEPVTTTIDAPVASQAAPTAEADAPGTVVAVDNAIVEASAVDPSRDKAVATEVFLRADAASSARGHGATADSASAASAPPGGAVETTLAGAAFAAPVAAMAPQSAASGSAAELPALGAASVAPGTVDSSARAVPGAASAKTMASAASAAPAPASAAPAALTATPLPPSPTPVPTPAPTAIPPTATPAAVAAVQPAAESAPVVAAAPAPAVPISGRWFIPIIQLAAALATVTFGLLWWRSRRR